MSQNRASLSHSVSSAFLFLLIGLFAVCSLILTLIGSRVYNRVTNSAAGNSDSQLVLSYLCNKVRTFDTQGSITLSVLDGIPVLCLSEDVYGEPYETDIYVYQGTLRESFGPAGDVFNPGSGERLVDVSSLRFSLVSPSLLETTVVLPNGDTRTLRMALRAGPAQEAN
jgi:hypothetical protein